MARSDGNERETIDPQEHMARVAPVLTSLPPGTQVCFIEEGDEIRLYNVNRAIELTTGREPTAVIDVAARARLIVPKGSGEPAEDTAQIDPDHALSVDLSYPVLVLAWLNEMDGSPGRVIDGWHRIYRAAQLGIAELPAIVISEDEEALIRIDPNARGE